MGIAVFDKTTKIMRIWTRYDTPTYNPTTEVLINTPERPDRVTKRWDDATGIRNATAQEVANAASNELDIEAQQKIDVDKFNRLLFNLNFDQENRLRVLEGGNTITKAQYKDILIATYKALS